MSPSKKRSHLEPVAVGFDKPHEKKMRRLSWGEEAVEPTSFELLATLRIRTRELQLLDMGGSSQEDEGKGFMVPLCGFLLPENRNGLLLSRAQDKKASIDWPKDRAMLDDFFTFKVPVQACTSPKKVVGKHKQQGRSGQEQDAVENTPRKVVGEEQRKRWKTAAMSAGCARCLAKETVLDICKGEKIPPILPLKEDLEERRNSSMGRVNRPRVNVRNLGKAGTHQALPWAVLKMGRFVVRRSRIAEYGVYTTESIPEGELLMEYVGEVVRKEVAELREKRYANMGLEHGTYLFSLGPAWVIDATKTGNMARYINHSCDPNCVAELVTPNSRDARMAAHQRRVFIYSKREILPGEELCYDYKLSAPDVSGVSGGGEVSTLDLNVKCQCGARECRGFL